MISNNEDLATLIPTNDNNQLFTAKETMAQQKTSKPQPVIRQCSKVKPKR